MRSEEKINCIRKNFESGTFTCSDIVKMGYHRNILSIMMNRGVIKKVGHGIYKFNNVWDDDEYIFQLEYSKAIFSKNTSLYLLGYITERPKIMSITIKQGYNCSSMKEKEIEITRVIEKYYDLGIIEIQSYSGNLIRLYNIERTICDIIRDKNYQKSQISNVIKKYLSSKGLNLDKLYLYAKELKVYDKVKLYIGILTIT